MKLMIASDLHGDAVQTRALLDIFEQQDCSRLVLLGDILYHGPRNDLPAGYAPKQVIAMLNPMAQDILCVRGNCDAEVDQMVLSFPIMADYNMMVLNDRTICFTHGHIYNADHSPMLKKGDILIHGHTHIPVAEHKGEITILNPGSISIPKGGFPPSYMLYEEGLFQIKDFSGHTFKELSIN